METLNAPIEYSVSKKTLSSYCKNLSKRITSGLRINVVSPGNILMKGNNWDEKLKSNKKQVLNYIKNNVPLKRFGSPDDIAKCSFIFVIKKNRTLLMDQI